MIPWKDVAKKPEFRKLPRAERKAAADQYFNEVVSPQVPENERAQARAQFDADTRKDITQLDPGVGRGDYLLNRAKQGVANFATLPAAVGDAARSTGAFVMPWLMPFAAIPQTAEEAQRSTQEFLGYDPDMLPPSVGTKYAGGVVEFGAGGIAPGGLVVGAARRKLPAIAAEVASTVGGGVGQEAAGPVGGILGGLSAAMFPSAVSNIASRFMPKVRGVFGAKEPAAIAGKEIAKSMEAHAPATSNLSEAEQLAKDMQDIAGVEFAPTLGQRSGAPGIIAREQAIAGSSGPDLGRFASRYTENEDAIRRFGEATFPAGGGTPQTSARRIQSGVTSELERRLDDMQAQRERLAASLRSGAQQETGEQLQALRRTAQQTARGVKDTKIKAVYEAADQQGVAEDMSDVVALVKKVGGTDENIFQNMPPVFGKVIREFGTEGAAATGRSVPEDIAAMQAAEGTKKATASFEAMHSLWRQTNREIGEAVRAGDMQKHYYLRLLKDSLDEKISKYSGEEFGELARKFEDFNTFYAKSYAPAFKEGVGGKMVAKNKYGQLMKPEDVVDSFFTPSGIDDFNLIYGSDGAAQAALQDGVIGLFRKAAVKGGKLDAKAAASWMRRNAETLDKLPDVKAALSDATKADAVLMASAKRVLQAESDFNKSFVARLAKTDKPEEFLDAALGNPKDMKRLIALGRDVSEKAVVARAVAQRLPAAADKAGIEPIEYLMRNQAALKPLLARLGERHWDNLVMISKASSILRRSAPPMKAAAPKVGDPIEEIAGSTGQSMLSQLRAVTVTRQGSPHYAMANILARKGLQMRREHADALMREAIYDPDVAKELAAAVRAPAELAAKTKNSLLNHLASLGIRVELMTEE